MAIKNARMHTIVHTDVPMYQCSVCSAEFRNDTTGKNHVKKTHGGGTLNRINVKYFENLTKEIIMKIKYEEDGEEHRPPPCLKCNDDDVTVESAIDHLVAVVNDETFTRPEVRNKINCPVCTKEINIRKENSMRLHLRVHQKEAHDVLTQCLICKERFSSVTTYLQHQKDHYRKENAKEYLCRTCDKKFVLYKDIEKHVFRVHSDVPCYKCSVCPAKFTDPNFVTTHCRNEHPEHARATHGKRGRMEKLDNDYTRQLKDSHIVKLNLPSVKLKLPKSTPVKKELSDASYPVKLETSDKPNGNLQSNGQNCSKDDLSQLQCPKCSYTSTSADDAFGHFYEVLEDDSFAMTPAKFQSKTVLAFSKRRCPVCEVRLKTSEASSLWKHLVSVHQGEAHQQAGTCQLCSLDFTLLANYYEHVKAHNKPRKRDLALKEEPRECPHCQKMLHSSRAYIRHLRLCREGNATGEFLYCEKCTYKTLDNKFGNGKLQRHYKRVHEESRKHPCDLCSMAFFSKTEKNNHQRTHFNERTFICDLCGKGFKNDSQLRGHRNKVHRKYGKQEKT